MSCKASKTSKGSFPLWDSVKKPPRIIKKQPKSRTKTGCFTCRRRKKKCDEQGPVCSGCKRNYVQCIWPSYATETLPKDFEIRSVENIPFGKSDSISNSSIVGIDIKEPIFFEDKKLEPIISEKDFSIDVPIEFCSVLELDNYKHQTLSAMTTEVPPILDFVLHDVTGPSKSITDSDETGNNSENNSDVNSDIISNKSSTSASIERNTLAEFVPFEIPVVTNKETTFSEFFPTCDDSQYLYQKSSANSEEEIYNDLLSYRPKTNIPSVSIKNPTMAAIREIICAKSLNKLSGTSENRQKSERHYSKAISIVREYNNSFTKANSCGEISDTWETLVIKIMCIAGRKLDLVSESSVNDIITNAQGKYLDGLNTMNPIMDNSLRSTLFNELLFNYPIVMYFSPLDNVLSLPTPYALFNQYGEEFSKLLHLSNNQKSTDEMMSYKLLSSSPSSTSSSTDGTPDWLLNVIKTSIFNLFECLSKLTWILRMKKSFETQQLVKYLKDLKADISFIWTTIQTSDIQLDGVSSLGFSPGLSAIEIPSTVKPKEFNPAVSLIEFAKIAYMSTELFYIKVADENVSVESPIIGFYMDQFMSSYNRYLQLTSPDEVSYTCAAHIQNLGIPKCLFTFPLFIAACAAQNLQQKEFISKEMYLLASNLDLNFLENLTSAVETTWCIAPNSNKDAFNSLITRDAFSGFML
ncbi:hypothetical protein DAMA08_037200 [Martiniozyma asiatica (nom. inval.)]|nr:hypothetical protein DAMA08_037200 [Martiniozyma asiatica]